ncbi:MAG: acetyl-CoA carboxylase biotin carboxyl carrier protein subunit [Bacteroidales bacterium]|nr:acetyl-CoA carboxylase biotin carboxyl carrier protein subunit [Bacteroidales bacterium]
MKTYKFKINGNNYEVAINSVEGKTASVAVNGTPYTVELEEAPAAPVQAPVSAPVPAAAAPAPAAAPALAPAAGSGKAVTSPLPGVIIAIKVNVGDVVKAGQEVAVLEAMKMENSIEATHDGTVTSINVSKGDSVLEGAPVVTIG